MIERLINPNGVLQTLLNSIENSEKISVFGCGMGEKLTILKECGKFILFLCEDTKHGLEAKEKFESINLKCEILDEGDDYLSLFSNNNKVLDILRRVLTQELDVLVITPAVLMRNLPQIEYVINSKFVLNVNERLDIESFISSLLKIGFNRKEYIEKEGEFSVRGDVVDLFYNSEEYYRIMFDFDVCGKIKKCDTNTKLPFNEQQSLTIYSKNYLQINEDALRDYINKNKGEYVQLLIEREQDKHNLMLFSQFANNLNESIFSYLPEDSVIAIDDSKSVYNAIDKFVDDFNNQLNSLVKDGKLDKSFKHNLLKKQINFPKLPVVTFQFITNANRFYNPQKIFNIASSPCISFTRSTQSLVQDIMLTSREESTIVVYAKTNEGCQKISRLFDMNRIVYNISNTLLTLQRGTINLVPKEYGISARFNEEGLFIYGSDDIFIKPKKVKEIETDTISTGFLPETNDYVVHNIYGIGKYLGIKCLDLKGGKRDYFVIEYKNNDILYLPVENISSISKYVGSDKTPALNKLGGSDFIKTKERVKSRIKESAINLVKLYAERQNMKGFVYPKDDEIMYEFEKSFGYNETADQLKAIAEVKQDMESGKLMDRLICGDVGFGKTEVALRCAFKTIMAGKQVAFMCPTTILSQQHYNTCLIRLKNFGINIEVLNRFKTPKECEQIFEKVKSGEVDIVVGTHKLLNKNLIFKNLGLLILDEEQKFGVEAKESIKDIKKSVNVLTLSATPIPRTMHLSLIGVRDISVIETPPTSRIPIHVSVMEYDNSIIENGVKRELGRGGQILIIYNKVESIYSFASKVKALVGDDVVIDVAHGQMEEKMLENAIYKLYNGETQVLISTTLIENGVDLPNANTLIVIDSDMLGLSQLYQLKGRIGRGDRQAYAYFTYNGAKLLNETAYKRLQAISQYTAMGSGFKIALRDLEIRGGGNVLGVEQSGHMEKVGYALYLQLLNEAIAEIKGKEQKQISDVKIETSISAFIPNTFVSAYNSRISLYLKISKINSVQKLKQTLAELIEIYGDIPEEVENLCKVSLIRELASHMLASKVDITQSHAKIYFAGVDKMNADIMSALENFSDYAVSNFDNSPIISLTLKDKENILDLLISFLQLCVESVQQKQ